MVWKPNNGILENLQVLVKKAGDGARTRDIQLGKRNVDTLKIKFYNSLGWILKFQMVHKLKAKMIRTERRKMKHTAKTIKLKIPMNQMVEAVLKNRNRTRNLHDKRIFQVNGDTHFNRRNNL